MEKIVRFKGLKSEYQCSSFFNDHLALLIRKIDIIPSKIFLSLEKLRESNLV